ncbi:MAG: DUF2281 domain-containing protein [Scytolyngbya sp. HA4215-MV1]|jgi:hypothetical protein|nr:DUF2281 domain-containing protein [Scytolyngbya sp. HA4215-MV1]
MGTPEIIYELVKTLPENQVAEVLDFVEFLRQKAELQAGVLPQAAIPKGTLTGLRGIAKRSGTPPTDAGLQEEYTDYLSQKYQ